MNYLGGMQANQNISKDSYALAKYGLVIWAIPIVILIIAAGIWHISNYSGPFSSLLPSSVQKQGRQRTFMDKFNRKYTVEEAGKRSESSSKNWWVNSGGRMVVSKGTGKTIMGDLSASDPWYKRYKSSNPEDTDKGLHPQNIFRLVGRDKFKNFKQEVFFRIKKINLSKSENRNESNGFLLFNRYQDEDNLYYAGLRADGFAVIKKKVGGDYHTLAQKRIFKGGTYNRNSNPNLLPVGKWMGIRTVVKTNKNGDVEISFYWKKKKSSRKWKLATSYVDKGQKGDKIEGEGYGGIRTDFMDVEFDKYKIKGD